MMDHIFQYSGLLTISSFISLIFSMILINIYISLAKKLEFFSVPHQGGVRQDIIPTSGGISFGLAYILMVLLYNNIHSLPQDYLSSIVYGSGLMLLTGFIDDIYSLSSSIRLIIQLIFVLMISFLFGIQDSLNNNLDYFILMPIIVLGSIWIINTFNFIDGADGLVSMNSAIFSLVGGIFLLLTQQEVLATILFMLCAVNLGFLYFNWAPAKVFMGDSGSLFLGSLFVIFSIGSYIDGLVSYWSWLILLSIFYVETTVTLLVRIRRKENVLSVHHSLHAYQQIIINSGKHSLPAKISILINFLWTVPMSFLAFMYPEYGGAILVTTCVPLALAFYYFGPFQAKKK